MSAVAPATATGEPLMPVKGKKKLIIIIALALLIVLAGGGAAWFVIKKRAAAAALEAGDDGVAGHGSAETVAHRSPPTYVPLEPFVVNLADKDSERYAQIGLTLEVDDPKFAEEMKLYMPAIRDAILMILAHKQSAELLERSGKQALAAEIMREAVRPMGIEIDAEAAPAAVEATPGSDEPKPAEAARPRKAAVHNPVQRVHFASFIVQ